jgi:hypothetical protein
MNRNYNALLECDDDENLFLNGGCHVFALSLHERLQLPLFLVRESASPNAAHVFCRSGEFAIDVMGFTLEQDIIEAKVWIHPSWVVEEASPLEMEKNYIYSLCPGLCAEPSFLRLAHARAKKRIDDYIKFYDGTFKRQIRPHPYLTKTTDSEYDNIFKGH